MLKEHKKDLMILNSNLKDELEIAFAIKNDSIEKSYYDRLEKLLIEIQGEFLKNKINHEELDILLRDKILNQYLDSIPRLNSFNIKSPEIEMLYKEIEILNLERNLLIRFYGKQMGDASWIRPSMVIIKNQNKFSLIFGIHDTLSMPDKINRTEIRTDNGKNFVPYETIKYKDYVDVIFKPSVKGNYKWSGYYKFESFPNMYDSVLINGEFKY